MRRRRNDEDRLTRIIADYLRMAARKSAIWYHVPNGGARNAITGAHLKRMGTRSGVADFYMHWVDDHGRMHVHYVEVKTATGRQSASQKDFEGDVRHLASFLNKESGTIGYHIVRSLDDAVKLFSDLGMTAS